MEAQLNLKGLLRVKIKSGTNLVVCDSKSSDPYVIVRLGTQKLKTRVIKKNLNPVWNEDLTLIVKDPYEPIKLTVYDHDTFTIDDKMGDAEVDIRPFLGAIKRNLEGEPDGSVIERVVPNRLNGIIGESNIVYKDGKVIQDLNLRLRNVDHGEIQLQLQWIDVPI